MSVSNVKFGSGTCFIMGREKRLRPWLCVSELLSFVNFSHVPIFTSNFIFLDIATDGFGIWSVPLSRLPPLTFCIRLILRIKFCKDTLVDWSIQWGLISTYLVRLYSAKEYAPPCPHHGVLVEFSSLFQHHPYSILSSTIQFSLRFTFSKSHFRNCPYL